MFGNGLRIQGPTQFTLHVLCIENKVYFNFVITTTMIILMDIGVTICWKLLYFIKQAPDKLCRTA